MVVSEGVISSSQVGFLLSFAAMLLQWLYLLLACGTWYEWAQPYAESSVLALATSSVDEDLVLVASRGLQLYVCGLRIY